jgi:hypothetical protein
MFKYFVRIIAIKNNNDSRQGNISTVFRYRNKLLTVVKMYFLWRR